MTDEPLVLDLFSCAGGAAKGYRNAGLRVVGVDIVPRPNYPFAFFQADALSVLRFLKRMKVSALAFHPDLPRLPDLIHASCPCQKKSTLTAGTNASRGWGREHYDFVPETRELLEEVGIPYVIEQPTGNGNVRADLRLCMDMFYPADFPPPWVQRHRDFEISGFTVPQPKHVKHRGRVRGMRHGVTYQGPYVAAYGDGGGKATVAEMQHVLGIDWTDVREELTEALPPAFTEPIGRAFLRHLGGGK